VIRRSPGDEKGRSQAKPTTVFNHTVKEGSPWAKQENLGPTERTLGVDNPIDPAPRSQARGEGGRVAEPRQIAAEPERAGGAASGRSRNLRRYRRASTGTGGKMLGRHAIQRVSSVRGRRRGRCTGRRDDGQASASKCAARRSPDLGAVVLGIGGGRAQGFDRRLEQEVLDHRLVVEATAAIGPGR
jgi:hypothetical protein